VAVVLRQDDYHVDKVQTITLSELLEALHGAKEDSTYRELCRIARSKHINFTHFVQLKGSVADLEPMFLQQAWDCGCTFQCTHDQPVFDLLFVTYSRELEAQWDNSKLGTFVVQVKLRANAAANTLVNQLTGPSIGETNWKTRWSCFWTLARMHSLQIKRNRANMCTAL
jgi:hypothetical protein